MKYDAIKSLPKGLVDDVAKFLKRESVEVQQLSEEVEQIDELSKGTLASYVKKAADDTRVNMRWAARTGDVESQNKVYKRKVGIEKAADKLAKEDIDLEDFLVFNEDFDVGVILEANEEYTEILFDEGVVTLNTADIMFEEVEQLDELSKATMQSYVDKAKADPAFEKKKGKPSKTTVAIRAKRESGIANAKEKLQAIVKAESEAHFNKMKKLGDKLDDHFGSEAPKILKKHGFEVIHTGSMPVTHAEGDSSKHITTYAKKHDNGHVSIIALHKSAKTSFMRSVHEAKALNTKGSSYNGHYPHTGLYDEKGYDKHMTEMMPNFEQHVIRVKNDGESASNW